MGFNWQVSSRWILGWNIKTGWKLTLLPKIDRRHTTRPYEGPELQKIEFQISTNKLQSCWLWVQNNHELKFSHIRFLLNFVCSCWKSNWKPLEIKISCFPCTYLCATTQNSKHFLAKNLSTQKRTLAESQLEIKTHPLNIWETDKILGRFPFLC